MLNEFKDRINSQFLGSGTRTVEDSISPENIADDLNNSRNITDFELKIKSWLSKA